VTEPSTVARAETLLELGRSSEARAALASLLAVEPENVEALVVLAEIQAAEGDPRGSRATAQRVLALEPDHLQALQLAAAACLDLDDVGEGIRLAREAVARAPWFSGSHALLAQAVGRRARGRAEALQAAERAIEFEPNDPIGYVAAGNVEMAHGKWKKAETWYRRALEVEPHNAVARTNLARAQESRGALSPAFRGTTSVLAVDPQDADALEALEETVYTTVVHLLWAVVPLLWLVGALRAGA
jgi:predicted Zn-dependent protease